MRNKVNNKVKKYMYRKREMILYNIILYNIIYDILYNIYIYDILLYMIYYIIFIVYL